MPRTLARLPNPRRFNPFPRSPFPSDEIPRYREIGKDLTDGGRRRGETKPLASPPSLCWLDGQALLRRQCNVNDRTSRNLAKYLLLLWPIRSIAVVTVRAFGALYRPKQWVDHGWRLWEQIFEGPKSAAAARTPEQAPGTRAPDGRGDDDLQSFGAL